MATEELHCLPCLRDGETIVASARCLDCAEELCDDCVTFHNKLKITSSHVVKTLTDTYSKDMEQKLPSCICIKHPTESVQFFCQDHKSAICGKCIIAAHRACKSVEYINSFSANLRTNDILKMNLHNLEHVREKANLITNSCVSNLDSLKEEKASIASKVSDIRQSVTRKLEVFEEECMKKLNEKTNEIENRIQERKRKVKDILERAEEKQTKLAVSEQWGSNFQLVTVSTETVDKFKIYKKEIDCIGYQTEFLDWSLPDIKVRIEPILRGSNLNLRVNKPVIKDTFDNTINSKFTCDKNDCFIVGVGMLDNTRIVVYDGNNSALKLLNLTGKQLHNVKTDNVRKVVCFDSKSVYGCGGNKGGLMKFEAASTRITQGRPQFETVKILNLIKYKNSFLMLTAVKDSTCALADVEEIEFKFLDSSMNLTHRTLKPKVQLSAWRGFVFDDHTSSFVGVNLNGMSLVWMDETGKSLKEKSYDNVGRGGFSGLVVHTQGCLFAAATRRIFLLSKTGVILCTIATKINVYDIALNAKGDKLVAVGHNNSIQIFTID